MNVVINFHNGDQESAKLLLYMLMHIDEGTACKYYIQYGDDVASLKIEDTILEFCSNKEVEFSNKFPEINLLQDIVDNGRNNKNFKGNHTNRSKNQKWKHLQWNLCIYKYLNLLDHFLMLEPDSVIFRDKWLKNIEEGFLKSKAPIYGHLKYGKINGEMVPTHWAGSSVYNSKVLRELELENYFSSRFKNPWWELRNLPNTETDNNCFWGPDFSGYDISYDYFLYALYWIKKTGSENPYDWKDVEQYNAIKDIVCDFNTELESDEIIARYDHEISLFHGIKSDDVRITMSKNFSNKRKTYTRYPLAFPENYTNKLDGLITLKQFKNKFKGERCFIIGNGPSIKQTDLTILKNEFTFGLNRIYLNYEKMGYEPTFYCAVNNNIIEQFYEDIDELSSFKFISDTGKEKLKNKWNTFFVRSLFPGDSCGILKIFKNDLVNGINSSWDGRHFNTNFETCSWHEGWTVTYCALQVAYYMGFSTVFLIGVDHNFISTGEANKNITEQGDDKNHFHPDYFGKGVIWQYPDLKRSEESYRIAKRVYERDGRKILDATIGGKLYVFPKVQYRDIPFGNWDVFFKRKKSLLCMANKFIK